MPVIREISLNTQDCADHMLRGIPLRRLWYYVEWRLYLVGHLYSLFPEFFDWFVRFYLPQTSHLFN